MCWPAKNWRRHDSTLLREGDTSVILNDPSELTSDAIERMTVGELVEECCAKPDTTSRKQLQRYRNLGRNSADEILIKLFYYQFSILPESRRKEYMRRIAEANR